MECLDTMKRNKKVLLHRLVNASAHMSLVGMAKINEKRFELVPHPPYLPDLALSEFFSIHILKKRNWS